MNRHYVEENKDYQCSPNIERKRDREDDDIRKSLERI